MQIPENSLQDPACLKSIESAVSVLSLHPDFQVIRRFVPRDFYHRDAPVLLHRGIILDVESTGKDITTDKIIELGMVKFEYCPVTGLVYRVLGTFNQLEDPGMPISEGASLVNGITDEMVAGKRINDSEVYAFIEDAHLIIAHNASFDRPMVEQRFSNFSHFPWGCSYRQVAWAVEGFGTQKLDYIAYRLGFFFEGHRAESDCRALLEILQRPLPVSEGTALKQILESYSKEDRRIWALEAKFDKKDDLKGRGYRWGDGTKGTEKAWYMDVAGEEFATEIAWLKANIYANRSFRVAVDAVDGVNRFSSRFGKRENIFC